MLVNAVKATRSCVLFYTFNSLFEMQVVGSVDSMFYPIHTTFNSLFEMPDALGYWITSDLIALSILYLRCCTTSSMTARLSGDIFLSILYLRCQTLRDVSRRRLAPVAFNSLFEMPDT